MDPTLRLLLRSLSALALLATATAALALPPGTANGTLTVNGKTVKLVYAYARLAENPFDKKKQDIVVLLSDVPVSPATFADHFGPFSMANDGKLNGLELEFDTDKAIISGTLYSAFAKDTHSISVSGMHKFEPASFSKNEIAGKVFIPEPDDFFSTRWQYSADFHAVVGVSAKNGANAPADRPATSHEGQMLAADGGAPGTAYRIYLKALTAGDLPALRKTVAPDRVRQMDSDPDFKKMFVMIQQMEPKNIRINGGTIDGKNATLNVSAKDGTSSSTGTVAMVLEGGTWKVDKESWDMH